MNKHGGNRTGAGRPRKYPGSGKKCSFFISSANLEWIKAEAVKDNKSMSEIVNEALAGHQKNLGS